MEYIEVQNLDAVIVWYIRVSMAMTISLLSFLILPKNQIVYSCIVLPIVGIWIFIELIRLTVSITPDKISFQYRPLSSRSFERSEVRHAEVIDYGFVGGYGIRKTKKYGTIYNTSGSKGIKLTLKSGEILVIGIQDVPNAKVAVDRFLEL